MNSSRKCDQCEKPGLVSHEGSMLLCIDCNLKFQQAQQIEHDRYTRDINYHHEEMVWTAGLSNAPPRYQEPQPIIHTGPITNHNIQIHGSVVGAINTGQIKNMNVALDHVQTSGSPELATRLQQLTEAVTASSELSQDLKKKAFDQLAFLTKQASLPREKRNASIGATILEGLERIINTSSGLLRIWQAAKPLIEQLF